MKKNEEVTIQSETIFNGRVISLELHDVKLPNGRESKREIIKHPGAVAIIPFKEDGKIVMVEQYRKAMERNLLEIPAGKLEKGEAPEVTARRELEEETGYGCEKLKHIISFYTSPGFADELVHVYEATGLYEIEDHLELDEDEFVELVEVTLEEAEEYIRTQRIFDAKTAFAVQYARLKEYK
ncbi:NUDIX hydrolase [Bacillus coahuilensis]|uniref:NUDIX hydrolase n=1 Tax=Bacillus coahuilensis TaxID=408580 RepID=UPI000185100D|nr:NUDIX hydrolase [Bacillus coahuilensis]